MIKNKKFYKNIHPAILITVVVLLLAASIGAFIYFRKDENPSNPSDDSSFINLDPPTEEEKNAANEQKQRNIENEEKDNTPPQSGKTAHVIITDAGQYDSTVEVRAFVPDHYQDGTCTITFTQGTKKVSKDTPAYRDASTTVCTNPLFKRSEFPSSGEWQVVVSYKAADASGTSDPKTITLN